VSQEWIALWAPMTRSWDAWLLCVVLAGLVPFHGLLAYRRLASAADPIPTRTKLRLYATIIVMEWALVAAAAVLARRHGLTPGDLGQTLGNHRLSLAVTVAGLVGLCALTAFNTGQIRRAKPEELFATVRRARKFVPVGGVEIAVFALVSVTAGICEEILYRGWLVSFLGAASGSIWIGMVLAAVLFGFGHAYQGRAGIIGTGILGMLFGGMFVLVRSLVPGEVIHAAIDLVNGILAGRIVRRLGPETAGPPAMEAMETPDPPQGGDPISA
jgi:membrane protease YdiL (CAAX protease family)